MSDFTVECDVTKILVEKKFQFNNDVFLAQVRMSVKILERTSGQRVFDQNLKYVYNTKRDKDNKNLISDEKMFNYCLSVAFQNALEKIKFLSTDE